MLFSLRIVVLLYKWEFKNIEVEFLNLSEKFDHQDFQILEQGSPGTSWFWQLVQALSPWVSLHSSEYFTGVTSIDIRSPDEQSTQL